MQRKDTLHWIKSQRKGVKNYKLNESMRRQFFQVLIINLFFLSVYICLSFLTKGQTYVYYTITYFLFFIITISCLYLGYLSVLYLLPRKLKEDFVRSKFIQSLIPYLNHRILLMFNFLFYGYLLSSSFYSGHRIYFRNPQDFFRLIEDMFNYIIR